MANDEFTEAVEICEFETGMHAYSGFKHNGVFYIFLIEGKELEDDDPLCYGMVKDGEFIGTMGFADAMLAASEDPSWEASESAMIIFDK